MVQKTFVDGDLYFDIDADRERQALIDELEERLGGGDEEETDEEEGEGSEEEEVKAPDPPETIALEAGRSEEVS